MQLQRGNLWVFVHCGQFPGHKSVFASNLRKSINLFFYDFFLSQKILHTPKLHSKSHFIFFQPFYSFIFFFSAQFLCKLGGARRQCTHINFFFQNADSVVLPRQKSTNAGLCKFCLSGLAILCPRILFITVLKNKLFYFEMVLDLQKMCKHSLQNSHIPFTHLLLTLTSYTPQCSYQNQSVNGPYTELKHPLIVIFLTGGDDYARVPTPVICAFLFLNAKMKRQTKSFKLLPKIKKK